MKQKKKEKKIRVRFGGYFFLKKDEKSIQNQEERGGNERNVTAAEKIKLVIKR